MISLKLGVFLLFVYVIPNAEGKVKTSCRLIPAYKMEDLLEGENSEDEIDGWGPGKPEGLDLLHPFVNPALQPPANLPVLKPPPAAPNPMAAPAKPVVHPAPALPGPQANPNAHPPAPKVGPGPPGGSMTDPRNPPGPTPGGFWEWNRERHQWEFEDYKRKRRQVVGAPLIVHLHCPHGTVIHVHKVTMGFSINDFCRPVRPVCQTVTAAFGVRQPALQCEGQAGPCSVTMPQRLIPGLCGRLTNYAEVSYECVTASERHNICEAKSFDAPGGSLVLSSPTFIGQGVAASQRQQGDLLMCECTVRRRSGFGFTAPWLSAVLGTTPAKAGVCTDEMLLIDRFDDSTNSYVKDAEVCGIRMQVNKQIRGSHIKFSYIPSENFKPSNGFLLRLKGNPSGGVPLQVTCTVTADPEGQPASAPKPQPASAPKPQPASAPKTQPTSAPKPQPASLPSPWPSLGPVAPLPSVAEKKKPANAGMNVPAVKHNICEAKSFETSGGALVLSSPTFSGQGVAASQRQQGDLLMCECTVRRRSGSGFTAPWLSAVLGSTPVKAGVCTEEMLLIDRFDYSTNSFEKVAEICGTKSEVNRVIPGSEIRVSYIPSERFNPNQGFLLGLQGAPSNAVPLQVTCTVTDDPEGQPPAALSLPSPGHGPASVVPLAPIVAPSPPAAEKKTGNIGAAASGGSGATKQATDADQQPIFAKNAEAGAIVHGKDSNAAHANTVTDATGDGGLLSGVVASLSAVILIMGSAGAYMMYRRWQKKNDKRFDAYFDRRFTTRSDATLYADMMYQDPAGPVSGIPTKLSSSKNTAALNGNRIIVGQDEESVYDEVRKSTAKTEQKDDDGNDNDDAKNNKKKSPPVPASQAPPLPPSRPKKRARKGPEAEADAEEEVEYDNPGCDDKIILSYDSATEEGGHSASETAEADGSDMSDTEA